MSYKLTQAVIDDVDAKLTLSEWAVLVVLSRCADDEGNNCYPSLETLALKSHACADTVRAALKGLVKKGRVSYTQEPGMKRKYTLAVPTLGQGVGDSEGVGKVIGVGNLGGVGKTEGVGEVQPLPLEKSYPTPRKSPTRRDKEENKEEIPTHTCLSPDEAPTVEDFGLEPEVVASEPVPAYADEAQVDRTPVKAFVDLYNEVLGHELGQVKKITASRQQSIRARYRDIYRDCNCVNEKEGLEMVRAYFECIKRSDFLMRRVYVNPNNPHANWRPDFDWFLKQKNYTKILEGGFSNGR